MAQTIKHQGVLIQKTLGFMDVRFGTMDRRFEAVDRRFNSLQRLIGGGFTFLTVVIVLMKFLVGP